MESHPPSDESKEGLLKKKIGHKKCQRGSENKIKTLSWNRIEKKGASWTEATRSGMAETKDTPEYQLVIL